MVHFDWQVWRNLFSLVETDTHKIHLSLPTRKGDEESVCMCVGVGVWVYNIFPSKFPPVCLHRGLHRHKCRPPSFPTFFRSSMTVQDKIVLSLPLRHFRRDLIPVPLKATRPAHLTKSAPPPPTAFSFFCLIFFFYYFNSITSTQIEIRKGFSIRLTSDLNARNQCWIV